MTGDNDLPEGTGLILLIITLMIWAIIYLGFGAKEVKKAEEPSSNTITASTTKIIEIDGKKYKLIEVDKR